MSVTVWRRHTKTCPYAAKGRDWVRCSCPLWADGYRDGKREFRKSLKTSDMSKARKRAAALEDDDTKINKPIHDAVIAFLKHCQNNGLGTGTQRKYTSTLKILEGFCREQKFDFAREITTSLLDVFRSTRNLNPTTASKELHFLKQFFGFCLERKWVELNPAKAIRAARGNKSNDIEPYTPAEIQEILSACDRIGTGNYERRRAKAMILVLRYAALRIGDMAVLRRERLTKTGDTWRIFLRTEKGGKPIFLPVPEEMVRALREVPTPRGTIGESEHFFWNGVTSIKSFKAIVDRSLRTVFQKSGVPKARAHRFRHTIATELLGAGASFEVVADILGNTPAMVRLHYGKWSEARQGLIDDLLKRVHSGAVYGHVLGTGAGSSA